jgi:hypothetical protein
LNKWWLSSTSSGLSFAGLQVNFLRQRTFGNVTVEKPITIEIVFKTWLPSIKARIRRTGWRFGGSRSITTVLDSMLDWRC